MELGSDSDTGGQVAKILNIVYNLIRPPVTIVQLDTSQHNPSLDTH